MTDTKALIEAFADAWNRHDLAAIMAMSTKDCEFWSSAGPDALGTRHVGQEAVAAAYREIFETFPDARWSAGRLTVMEGRALSEWTFVGTHVDGRKVEVLGLDILDLSGDKVRIKNSFRKNRTG